MIVTDISDLTDYPECLRSEAEEQGLTRSPGLHLSQIIHAIEDTIHPPEDWCSEAELAFFASGGFMWERVFSMAMRDSVVSGDLVRPGELTLDGIIGSPDLIRISDMTGIDTKMKWRSVRSWDDAGSREKNYWAWFTQCKAYAKMFGINVYEIHAFFVAGDWRPPIPQTRALRMEFTDKELNDTWAMITGYARNKGWL